MLRSKIGVNGNLHSRLRNDDKEATLNYRMSRNMARGGICTHALRSTTVVLPGSKSDDSAGVGHEEGHCMYVLVSSLEGLSHLRVYQDHMAGLQLISPHSL